VNNAIHKIIGLYFQLHLIINSVYSYDVQRSLLAK